MVNVDTLIEFRKLVQAGYTEAQAEAQVRLVADSAHQDMGGFATKADIDHLQIATQADISALRIATQSEIGSLKQELIHFSRVVYIFGSAMFVVVVLPAVQKFLGH